MTTQKIEEYLELERKLLKFRKEGTCSVPEENKITDELEAMWYKMSGEEQDKLRMNSFNIFLTYENKQDGQ